MIKEMLFSHKKKAMNSNQIFQYSDDFLEEIIDELISLKIKKRY